MEDDRTLLRHGAISCRDRHSEKALAAVVPLHRILQSHPQKRHEAGFLRIIFLYPQISVLLTIIESVSWQNDSEELCGCIVYYFRIMC